MFRIFTLVTVVFLLSLSPLESAGQGARLIWDANTEPNIGGYKVHYDIAPGNYGQKIDLGNVTECELSSLYLMEVADYYLALTAYYTPYTPENESLFSEEIFFDPDDGIDFSEDNCPYIYNPDQKDTFPPGGNGIGDACECESDFNCDGAVDPGDMDKLLEDFGRSEFFNECTNDNPCYGDFNCDKNVDVPDMLKFLEDFGRSEFKYNTRCPDCEVGNWCDYPES